MSLKWFAVLSLFLLVSQAAVAEGPALRLNSPGTVITGPTEATVDLLMPDDPDQQCVAALIVIEYDPAMVTLSNPAAADPALWNDFSSYPLPEFHQLRVLMLTDSFQPGPATTGPLLRFTVAPVGASADLSACAALRLVGGAYGQDYTSNLAIFRPSLNDYDSVWTPSSCGPLGPIYVPPVVEDTTTGGSSRTTGNPILEPTLAYAAESHPPLCVPDVVAAGNALRMYAGLSPVRERDLQELDRDGDERITFADVRLILQEPCAGPIPKWSISFTNALCSNPPAIADIDRDTNGYQEVVFTSDYQNPDHYNPDVYRSGNPQQVWVISATANGEFGFPAGWPRPLRDAPNGIAVANFAGNVSDPQDPWEVLVNNFQDNYNNIHPYTDPITGERLFGMFTHLQVWGASGGSVDVDGDGVQDFASDREPGHRNSRGRGHAASAPAVFDINNDGRPEVFHHFQGEQDSQLGFVGGGMRILAPYILDPQTKGTLLYQTGTDPGAPWYIRPTDTLIHNPPVFPKFGAAGSLRNVVLASDSGYVYAWDSAGNTVPGWEPGNRSQEYTLDLDPTPTYTDFLEYTDDITQRVVRESGTLYTPIAAGNVDNDPGEEVVAASGLASRYYGFCIETRDIGGQKTCIRKWPAHTLDGAVYCWKPDGTLKWRYPRYIPGQRLQQFLPAFTSGVSLGRLLGPTGPVCVVVGDVNGQVTVLNASLPTTATDEERVIWCYQTHSPIHIGYRQIRTQPLIADVNGDHQQDVIVGTGHGYVHALDGATGTELWRTRTFADVPPSHWPVHWPPSYGGPQAQEGHYEEVRGLAVGNLYGGDPSRAAIVVCSSAFQDTGAPLRGHMMILDCGPNTWNPDSADWPQWGRTPQRTGTLSLP